MFSSIGVGFFIYGKKQARVVPLLCGVTLVGFPYFVSNNFLLVAIGTALVAIPYFVRLWRSHCQRRAHAVRRCATACSPSRAIACSRNSILRTLPLTVIGNSCRISR